MTIYVPDASVILKWVLPPDNEAHTEQALAMRTGLVNGARTLAVPPLWYFEVGNTLSFVYDIADLFKFDGVVPRR